MKGPLKLGLLLAAVALSSVMAFGHQAGWSVFFVMATLLALMGGAAAWVRTRLRLAASGMFLGAVVGFALIWGAATERDLRAFPPALLLGMAVVLAAAGGCFWAERRKRPKEWEAWRRAVQRASLSDLLRGRHLRQTG